MEILSIILICIGVIIGLVFGIQLLILAFRTSIWWGLGYIFVPLVGLIFVIVHWSEAKKPFLLSLLSIPFYVGGLLISRGLQPA
jgi:FtsH-binding integral membrane protein